MWDLLQQEQGEQLSEGHTIERMLWAMFLLKTYAAEEVDTSLANGCDEQTFRHWAWDFIKRICELECVVVSNVSLPLCRFSRG